MIIEIDHSLEKSFAMTVSTFVNLQGFIVGKKFIVKEVAVLRKGFLSLSLHFYMSHAMEFLDKIRKVLCFLAECLSPWIAMERRDDPVQHGETPDYDSCNWCGRR